MGFSIDATVCIGAVIESMDECDELEDSLPKGFELDFAGSGDDPETIVLISRTKSYTYWGVMQIEPTTDVKEKTKVLTDMLDSINIEYTKAGLLLYPYYSH